MGTPVYSDPPSQPYNPDDHLQIRSLLHEYIAYIALGQTPAPAWQPLEQHLARCPSCRYEAESLLQLMTAVYSGPLEPAENPPPPRLDFLNPTFDIGHLEASAATRPRTWEPLTPTIVLPFSSALLTQMHVRITPRSGNVRKRYEHTIPPHRAQDPTVKIEIFELSENAAVGQVRICVEHPDRNPFDQAGTTVLLEAGAATFSAQTNPSGVVVFSDIPLDMIDSWQLSIIPAGEG